MITLRGAYPHRFGMSGVSCRENSTEKEKRKKTGVRSKYEVIFKKAWDEVGPSSETLVEEFSFHPTRKWRIDFALVKYKIAIEIDGGTHLQSGGRHNQDADREKINELVLLGWQVVRFSGSQVQSSPRGCVLKVVQFIERSKKNENKVR